jgi:predicted amidophosphoribosyltransferase
MRRAVPNVGWITTSAESPSKFMPDSPRKCPYCYSELKDGARFCASCGREYVDSDDVRNLAEIGDRPRFFRTGNSRK